MSIMKIMLPPITILASTTVVSKLPVLATTITVANYISKGIKVMTFLNSLKDFFSAITENSENVEKVGLGRTIFQTSKSAGKLIISLGTGLWTFALSTSKDVIEASRNLVNSDLTTGQKVLSAASGIFSFVKNGAIYVVGRVINAYEVAKPVLKYLGELLMTGAEIVSVFLKGLLGSSKKSTETVVDTVKSVVETVTDVVSDTAPAVA